LDGNNASTKKSCIIQTLKLREETEETAAAARPRIQLAPKMGIIFGFVGSIAA